MNCYIYAADTYCEACGERLRDNITASGHAPADPDDETSYDSDDFPKGPFDASEESDGPKHCGSHAQCLLGERLSWKKVPVGVAGCFFENDLTSAGVKYLVEMVTEPVASDYQKAIHKLWLDFYRPNYPEISKQIAAEVKAQQGVSRHRFSKSAPTSPSTQHDHSYCAYSGLCVPHSVDSSEPDCGAWRKKP